MDIAGESALGDKSPALWATDVAVVAADVRGDQGGTHHDDGAAHPGHVGVTALGLATGTVAGGFLFVHRRGAPLAVSDRRRAGSWLTDGRAVSDPACLSPCPAT
ncbi:hypothetical protein OG806_26745 [Streptomyces sp. NBC_00882]|uniref:hypothetical protein n=1 Tax=Streptomyces TaxID=1883 RepID=UPI00386C2259|nr:hypothetical protein OG806_26745 [Streptomyces sp. NBC_00882]WSZ59722.1 hypothetical protein OH824_25820 [Streptomyces canus]